MLHSFFTFAAVFTMYFNGGLVPTYLIVKAMGLIDSVWSLIIPGLINTFYMIILRTAIMGVPQEMTESAALDGAGELKILIRIMIPLIIPTIVAIALFVMVGYWNSWTSALLYIQDPKKYPLQMVLRQILIINDASASAGSGSSYQTGEDSATRMLLKYATIIISVIPIIIVYIPLQKYFTKGIMIGALKG
jgi:putative aldouronate transport system permease protein